MIELANVAPMNVVEVKQSVEENRIALKIAPRNSENFLKPENIANSIHLLLSPYDLPILSVNFFTRCEFFPQKGAFLASFLQAVFRR